MLTRRAGGPRWPGAAAAAAGNGCCCCCCCVVGGEVPDSALPPPPPSAPCCLPALLLLLLPPSSGQASLCLGTGLLPEGSWHRQYSALPLLRNLTNSLKSSWWLIVVVVDSSGGGGGRARTRQQQQHNMERGQVGKTRRVAGSMKVALRQQLHSLCMCQHTPSEIIAAICQQPQPTTQPHHSSQPLTCSSCIAAMRGANTAVSAGG